VKVPLRLIPKNLLKHPLRSLLTVLSLAVALFLLCLLRSLVVTLDAGVENSKSDRVIAQSAVSLFVFLPESYLGKIRAIDGVAEAIGWTWFGGYYQKPENFFAQFAVDADRLLAMYPEMEIIEGSEEAFLEGGGGGRLSVGATDVETQGVEGESQGEGRRSRGGAVFDGEDKILGSAPEVEVGVPPGVEVRATA